MDLRQALRGILLSPPKALVAGYALIITTGTILLQLPAATATNVSLGWIDAFFMATSATCVTGLSVIDVGARLSLFGELVLLTLVQIGGIGFITFATFFALLMGKKISLKERLLLQQSLNQVSIEGIVRLVKRIIIFTTIIELVGGLLLALRFSFDMSVGQALYYGFFHAITLYHNAGFDLLGSSFLGYVEDPYMTLVIGSLIILGGIGFIVMSELYEYRQTRRLSLHTKLVLSTSGILIAVGTLFIFLLEFNNPHSLQPLSAGGKFWASLFQSITPRSGGASTLNIGALEQSTLFLLIFLMFIGASPGSTGGGIKVTTFATLVGAVWAQFKGKEDVVFFRQRLVPDVIYKALTVTISGLFIIIIVATALSITERGVDFLAILFETTSAFGTVGLTMGLTSELSPIGRIIIACTMFIGRVGPLTIAFALAKRRQKEYYRYPKGKIMIG